MRNIQAPDWRPITKTKPWRICFVCLGNICRSPTAEGIFQHLVSRDGLSPFFEIDSAGTAAYHVGEPANSRSKSVAEKNGVVLHSRARKFEWEDLDLFDLVLAMDKENLEDLQAMDRKKKYSGKILLIRDFDPIPGDREVPDPYYGGIHGFEMVFEILLRSCEALLDQLKPHLIAKP